MLWTDLTTGLPDWYVWLIVCFIGLAIGSFTTCVIYRVPRGLSIWRNADNTQQHRSFCPICRHPLGLRDLVPVFSWVLQRGRCRYCHASIGFLYPMVEVGVLACVILLHIWLKFSIAFLLSIALIPCVMAVVATLLRKKTRL